MIKRRIPAQALQKSLCALLDACQTTAVYEYIKPDTRPPYITFGEISASLAGGKTDSIYDAIVDIEIYSTVHTRREVNEIMNDVATVLSSARLDMSADGYAAADQDIVDMRTYPSEAEGYNGVIRINIQIQDMEE